MSTILTPKVLITGDSGLLGANLAYLLQDSFDILGVSRRDLHVPGIKHVSLDLCNEKEIFTLVHSYRPNVIINTAALVNIEQCESNPNLAYAMNTKTVMSLANAAAVADAYFIHISTDAFYVSPNGKSAVESDLPVLRSIYGKTKYEAEKYVLSYDKGLILRTNFYGFNFQDKASFSEWILKDLMLGKRLTMVRDVFFSPIFVNDLVQIIHASIKAGLTGLFNAGCTGFLSKYEFAVNLRNIFGIERGEIVPTSVNDLMLSAWRSNNMAMDNSRLQKALGINIPKPIACLKTFHRLYLER